MEEGEEAVEVDCGGNRNGGNALAETALCNGAAPIRGMRGVGTLFEERGTRVPGVLIGRGGATRGAVVVVVLVLMMEAAASVCTGGSASVGGSSPSPFALESGGETQPEFMFWGVGRILRLRRSVVGEGVGLCSDGEEEEGMRGKRGCGDGRDPDCCKQVCESELRLGERGGERERWNLCTGGDNKRLAPMFGAEGDLLNECMPVISCCCCCGDRVGRGEVRGGCYT